MELTYDPPRFIFRGTYADKADVATLARVSIATVHRAEKGRVLNARIQHRLERFVEKMGEEQT